MIESKNRLTLHTPLPEELSFRQRLLSDEATMSYNARWGGCVDFPPERWEGWYDRWITHPQGQRFYAYLHSGQDGFVGEAACHLDENGRWMLDVIVLDRFRGRGYGTQGLALLCERCRQMGCAEVYDDIAADNPGSIRLFINNGFIKQGNTENGVLVKKIL